MHPFEEMKAYVRFDDEQAALLADFWPLAEPHAHDIAAQFYDRILEFPDARSVFEDESQVSRLQRTLVVWLEELLCGPHDHAYHERRTRIGMRHVAVGLHHRYMFTAMQVVRDRLCEIAHEHHDDPDAHILCRAIDRVTSLDLAIMTGTYMSTRVQNQLATLEELIVSHLPVTVLLVGSDGKVRNATRPSARLFQTSQIEGLLYTDALPTELVEACALEHHVRRAMESGHDVSLPRVDTTLGDRTRSFRINIVPIRERIAGFLLHIEELTATVSTEARLRRAESLARIGALSAGVAHELRNPLAGISGAVQVITSSLDEDDRRRRIMEKVLSQIARLNRMVTDLLAFARPKEAKLAAVDLTATAREVIDLVTTEHDGLTVSFDGDGQAMADEDHVHRILLNLLENATHATGGTGPIQVLVDDGVVLVSDDGVGIPDDKRDRIFEPFMTTKTQGTGLGLAICLNSAETMGGRLELLDEGPLGGATFRLALQLLDR